MPRPRCKPLTKAAPVATDDCVTQAVGPDTTRMSDTMNAVTMTWRMAELVPASTSRELEIQVGLFDALESGVDKEDERFGGFWSLDSLAVVACDGNGHGCVLFTVGPHIAAELEDVGRVLGDIGLDDAPAGISVWQGRYISSRNYWGVVDGSLEGEFRNPTPAEWAEIQRNKNPWMKQPSERLQFCLKSGTTTG